VDVGRLVDGEQHRARERLRILSARPAFAGRRKNNPLLNGDRELRVRSNLSAVEPGRTKQEEC
jgi:hypothetical protein